MAQQVQNPPAVQETREMQVWSLGWADHLEEEMATCSRIPAWKTSWTEEPGRLESMGLQRVRHDLVTKQQTYNINNTRNKRQLLLILWTFIDNINIVPDIE